MSVFYPAVFIISLCLSGIYFLKWQKRFDVYSVVFYSLIPIVELGYYLLSVSKNVEEAIAVNKFVYIGACFLYLFIMLCIFSACRIKLHKLVSTGLFLLTCALYTAIIMNSQGDLFYRRIILKYTNGITVLKKEYGPLHTLFYVYIVLLFAAAIAAIIYTYFKKKDVSLQVIRLLYIIEEISIAGYLIGRFFDLDVQMVSIAYVVLQVMYLLVIKRICLYDISDNVISGLINDEEYAYISIDFEHRYLSSNDTAKKLFPELSEMRLDTKLQDSRFSTLITEWIQSFIADEHKDIKYEADDRTYSVQADYLVYEKKNVGYQITLNDKTEEQKYITLLNNYNDDLIEEVKQKTEHIEEMHDKLILGMAVMVEGRDNSTGGHIRRTSDCIKILIDNIRHTGPYELDEEFCKCLIKAAPMHDLGKIAVDDKVLRKPGRFEPEEFEQMKTHAAKGAEIIERILEGTDDDRFREIAINVAHYHHERMDGTGYPEKLKGEEIPLEARIMAVVDVYDALVSKRCYKESMPFDKAFAIIDEGMGTQFDPKLRESFHRARPELEAYYS